jgi:hypothetical protein
MRTSARALKALWSRIEHLPVDNSPKNCIVRKYARKKKWPEKSCEGQALWHTLRSSKPSEPSVCRGLELKELEMKAKNLCGGMKCSRKYCV